MSQKFWWGLAGLLLLLVLFGALWWFMPIDWDLFWRSLRRDLSPMLSGAAVGFGVATAVFLPGLQSVREKTLQHKIKKERQRHQNTVAAAVQQIKQQVLTQELEIEKRKAQVAQREQAAIAAQKEAETALQQANAAQNAAKEVEALAEKEVQQARFRARNAIQAAERIKRRLKQPPQPVQTKKKV